MHDKFWNIFTTTGSTYVYLAYRNFLNMEKETNERANGLTNGGD